MKNQIPIIIFLFLFSLNYAQENIHLALQRREYQTNLQEDTVPDMKQMTCLEDNPDALSKKKKASIKELCFFRNLFYNLEVSLGQNSKQNFELALDLLSPFTWVKSDNCSSCYQNDDKEFKCKKNCNMYDFSKTHQCVSKKKCTKTNKTATLDYINHNFTGKFSYENVRIESIDAEIPVVKIKRFKIMDVEIINNSPNYLSDGALGLGLEADEDDDDDDAEEDSGIMTAIINSASSINNRLFSIYIRENVENDDNYQPTIIFGEVNTEYQNNEDDKIDYINVNTKSKFDWDLPLYSLTFSGSGQTSEIVFNKSSAILTLDTTFISLPVKEINKLIDYLNSLNMNCKIDIEKVDSLYCANVDKSKLQSVKLYFNFKGTNNKIHSINIGFDSLMKDCKGNTCYFLINKSSSKSTILGEAFFKNYYVVFDMDNQNVGFVLAASKADEPISRIVKKEGRKFSRFLKYFFILLGVILVILCPFYIYQLCKIYKRKKANIRYEEGNSSIQMDKVGDDSAYDFQAEMKEKLEARKKAEAEQHQNQENTIKTEG